jgi:DNA-binding transcriptional regulator GbsR (MarR family)
MAFDFTKTYANKSDATRAARKAGVVDPVAIAVGDRWGIQEPKGRGPKGEKMDAARAAMTKAPMTAAEIAELNGWSKHTVTNFLCTLRTVENLKVERTRREGTKDFQYQIAS